LSFGNGGRVEMILDVFLFFFIGMNHAEAKAIGLHPCTIIEMDEILTFNIS
jgi:hypothetical protein